MTALSEMDTLVRLAKAEALIREFVAFDQLPVVDYATLLAFARAGRAFLAESPTAYELCSEGRLKGVRDAIEVSLEALQRGGYSAGRMCERLGITREEGHRAGVQWLANAITYLAECDYLKHEAKEMTR